MPSKRHKKTSDLFRVACEMAPDARAAFLEKACAGDTKLRAEVEALLAQHEQHPSFLNHPAWHEDQGKSDQETEAIRAERDLPGLAKRLHKETESLTGHPERVGPYKILQELGEGGMGIVYLAEQTEPIRRRVALKLIKLGMDTKQVIARFETERQALALMNHPNVAKVLDAGATEKGSPYFVMEYVKGESITAYCDRHRLTTRERLELFMQVCQAVQHAHQKGIIHRDIKPSNVLVTIEGDKPVPKVIDFGVAKATEQKLTERTLFTEQGQLIGTPEYMSPEQAEMTVLDIDTRTDIYSLGVLLYELLVGALPFEPHSLRRAAFGEIQRIIREAEPQKPSTRLNALDESESNSAASSRRTDKLTLERQLQGDLDWITLKAIDKDRTRRFGTATELAADIRRHLQHEPVQACPPSLGYRTKKFVRRHRAVVALTCGLGVALVIGIGGLVGGIVTAQRERETARNSADRERDARIAEQSMREKLEIANADARNRLETALQTAALVVEKVEPFLMTAAGGLETRTELMDAVHDFFESALVGEDDVRLMQLAIRAFRREGALAQQQGDTERAKNAVRASITQYERIVELEPTIENLTDASTFMAGVSGMLDASRAITENAIGMARRAVSINQQDTRALESLATVLALAAMSTQDSEPQSAQRWAAEARQLLSRLAEIDPTRAAEFRELTEFLPKIEANNTSSAPTTFSESDVLKDIQQARDAFDNDPENVIKRFELAGTILTAAMEHRSASFDKRMGYAEEAYRMMLPLYRDEPENTMYSIVPMAAAMRAELWREKNDLQRCIAAWREWSKTRLQVAKKNLQNGEKGSDKRYIWALFGSVIVDSSQAGSVLKEAEQFADIPETVLLRTLCQLRQGNAQDALSALERMKIGGQQRSKMDWPPFVLMDWAPLVLEVHCLIQLNNLPKAKEAIGMLPDLEREGRSRVPAAGYMNAHGLNYDLILLLDEARSTIDADF